MDYLFVVFLTVWTSFSILRIAHMYDRQSWLACWRQWDWFHLIPVGAFFSPRVPQTEYCLLFRDLLADGQVTAWTESPRLRSRCWWHSVWNPQKHLYRAKTDVARSFFSVAADLTTDCNSLPPSFVLSEPYLAILLYVTKLPRISRPQGIQFAVMEKDILTEKVIRMLVSSVHEF